jgi:hypothetical protein
MRSYWGITKHWRRSPRASLAAEHRLCRWHRRFCTDGASQLGLAASLALLGATVLAAPRFLQAVERAASYEQMR